MAGYIALILFPLSKEEVDREVIKPYQIFLPPLPLTRQVTCTVGFRYLASFPTTAHEEFVPSTILYMS